MESEPIAEALSGIPPDRVVESYHSRRLEALSETELVRAVAHIVSQPKLELSSFRLHAPIEIMARYKKLLDLLVALQLQSADKTAKQLVARCIRRATRPSAIQGYEGSQPLIDAFSDDHLSVLSAGVVSKAQ